MKSVVVVALIAFAVCVTAVNTDKKHRLHRVLEKSVTQHRAQKCFTGQQILDSLPFARTWKFWERSKGDLWRAFNLYARTHNDHGGGWMAEIAEWHNDMAAFNQWTADHPTSQDQLDQRARTIFAKFIAPSAPYEINLPGAMFDSLKVAFANANFHPAASIFDPANEYMRGRLLNPEASAFLARVTSDNVESGKTRDGGFLFPSRMGQLRGVYARVNEFLAAYRDCTYK